MNDELTFLSAMFSASIFIVEADLHDKPATHNTNNNSNNNNENSSNSNNSNNRKDPVSGADTAADTKGNQNNEAPVKTNSIHSFLFNPIPKPEPIPEPPTSETVDDALGPKPEPIVLLLPLLTLTLLLLPSLGRYSGPP
ncbi:hypothetical protein KCU93_g5177, partial [Aureobasidium melanogenum]